MGLPPDTAFLSGVTLPYHYFSSLHVAFSSLVSNIDIFTLSFPLYPLTKSLLLIGGLNYLLESFHAGRWQKFLLINAIVFSTGFERISLVTNFHHFHLCPFGLDVGFSFSAFFLASITESFRKSERPVDWSLFAVVMLFFAAVVGVKAPLAVPLSIYAGGICLYWLLNKKYDYGFLYGISIAVIFLLISIFIVGMFTAFNHTENINSMRLYRMVSRSEINGEI